MKQLKPVLLLVLFIIASALMVIAPSSTVYANEEDDYPYGRVGPSNPTSDFERRFDKLFRKRENFLKRAATQFWEDRYDLSSLSCRPSNVLTHIYTSPSEGAVARVNELGYAFNHNNGRPGYCQVYFNRAWAGHGVSRTRAATCVTYIHEYGHLIGREHNLDIHSPMYNGYALVESGGYELYLQRLRNITRKSMCQARTVYRDPLRTSFP